ncbi:MAG: histidinol-phosphatase [candidate division Zixibacteria bacterium]|nr:histidinol-phosphatase [candidate division Zixibacteria bacterium]
MGKKIGDWYQYSGAVHVHTTESDGTKPLEEVVAIGQRADLDFMMLADHMTLATRDNGSEGMYGKMLVVIGYEHNDQDDRHHYLLFETPRVYPNTMTVREYVAAGEADGALGIMAHPDEIRNRMAQFQPYPWTDWKVEGFAGVELWNQMSEWMERLTPFNKLPMAFSPRKSMVGPTDRILGQWDQWNLKRKVVGVASVDAHAFRIKVGPFKVEIFPYKVHFRCLRTHILLDESLSTDFDKARCQLYDALRDCRSFCSNMRWGSAQGFEFYAEDDSRRVTCGGELPSHEGVRLVVKLPSRARLKLIHNGELVLQSSTDSLTYAIQSRGIYRVEAWKGRRGWIFSNHIRIGV